MKVKVRNEEGFRIVLLKVKLLVIIIDEIFRARSMAIKVELGKSVWHGS
jgi:hypothetical protein